MFDLFHFSLNKASFLEQIIDNQLLTILEVNFEHLNCERYITVDISKSIRLT